MWRRTVADLAAEMIRRTSALAPFTTTYYQMVVGGGTHWAGDLPPHAPTRMKYVGTMVVTPRWPLSRVPAPWRTARADP